MAKPIALVTNDDGIQSYFLQVLVEALQETFTVIVAAPQTEQSWIGRAVSRRRDVAYAPSSLFPGVEAYAIDGTPSDCVNIALGHLLSEKPDVVCSGINLGFNACLPIILSSGTIAGALEGAFWGFPALAFSQQVPHGSFETLQANHNRATGEQQQSVLAAAKHAAIFAEQVVGEQSEGPQVHNYNFPIKTDSTTPIEATLPAPFKLGSLFQKKDETTFHFRYQEGEQPQDGPYDYSCLKRGHISHTILDMASMGKSIS